MVPRRESRSLCYTRHARERMRQRGVSEDEVAAVVRFGAWEADGPDRWIARSIAGGRRLDVVFVELRDAVAERLMDRLLVVTVIDLERSW